METNFSAQNQSGEIPNPPCPFCNNPNLLNIEKLPNSGQRMKIGVHNKGVFKKWKGRQRVKSNRGQERYAEVTYNVRLAEATKHGEFWFAKIKDLLIKKFDGFQLDLIGVQIETLNTPLSRLFFRSELFSSCHEERFEKNGAIVFSDRTVFSACRLTEDKSNLSNLQKVL